MSLHHDHYSVLAAQQRRAELIAEAEHDRLGRLVRPDRSGLLRRLAAALTRLLVRGDLGRNGRPEARPRGDPAGCSVYAEP